ncbi:hypothetical protein KFE25_006215 [Diacronema lutheri]|uniref:Uncharacterized protein n=1 Tax=Diacronema lutheri TaxID=2081491 RepID=A0A8J6CH28_DIALT|nr:hypothetical protein KFE25_006215 [Diacronema lutheri]
MLGKSGSAAAAIRVSSKSKDKFAPTWAPSDQYLNKPVHVGPAFEKQTTRTKAVYGKLLSDVPMTKMLLATDWGQGGRDWYDGAADSMHRPLITRPRTGAVLQFSKQLTRKEAVVGKLLSDVAMTRMLLGTSWSQGGDDISAEADLDTFLKPPPTRKRANLGQHSFNKQIGRVDYHQAGLRGAPAKPGLGERGAPRTAKMHAHADARASRAASAPAIRDTAHGAAPSGSTGAAAARPTSAKGTSGKLDPFASLTDIPQRARPHVLVPDMSRQMPRDRWVQQPMRLSR